MNGSLGSKKPRISRWKGRMKGHQWAGATMAVVHWFTPGACGFVCAHPQSSPSIYHLEGILVDALVVGEEQDVPKDLHSTSGKTESCVRLQRPASKNALALQGGVRPRPPLEPLYT